MARQFLKPFHPIFDMEIQRGAVKVGNTPPGAAPSETSLSTPTVHQDGSNLDAAPPG